MSTEKAAYKLRTILQLRERIRALEAERDSFQKGWQAEAKRLEARVERLKAAAHVEASSCQIHYEARQRLEAEVERLASIHHVKCSLVTGSDVCDCQQNAGRVWLAKAYNGCAARAEKAKAELAVSQNPSNSRIAFRLKMWSFADFAQELIKAEACAEKAEAEVELEAELRDARIDAAKERSLSEVASRAKDLWRTRYKALRETMEGSGESRGV